MASVQGIEKVRASTRARPHCVAVRAPGWKRQCARHEVRITAWLLASVSGQPLCLSGVGWYCVPPEESRDWQACNCGVQ